MGTNLIICEHVPPGFLRQVRRVKGGRNFSGPTPNKMSYDPRFNDGDGLHGGLPLFSTTVGKQTHFLGVVHNPTLIFQFPIYLEPFAPRQPPIYQVTIDPLRELEDEGSAGDFSYIFG